MRKQGMVVLFTLLLPILVQAQGLDLNAKKTNTKYKNLNKIARDLSNPITRIWNLVNEFHYAINDGDVSDKKRSDTYWKFQPVIPLDIGYGLVFISRPQIPVYFRRQVLKDGEFKTSSGLGDIQYIGIVGKANRNGLLYGAGFTFSFPTASKSRLGTEKWAAGPAFIVGHFSRQGIYGVLLQHWWSYAGTNKRVDTNYTMIQPFYFYSLPHAWQLGASPVTTANWEANKKGNVWNVPLGLGLFKTVRYNRMPIKIGVEADYSFIHENNYGRRWDIKLSLIPVIPSLF